MTGVKKDERLAWLSSVTNVAQFVSFGSHSPTEAPRYFALRGGIAPTSLEDATSELLNRSPSHKVNIRTFCDDSIGGGPFEYGLTSGADICALARTHLDSGLHIILNELIPVNDGGVSGVSEGGIVEFAPKDTPRCVEKQGVARVSSAFAEHLFRRVYGLSVPRIPGIPPGRLEFSLHPEECGVRGTQSIVWEYRESFSSSTCEIAAGRWPNRFSQFIGDKVFGLLVAEYLGLQVPLAHVIARDLPPFEFGKPTGLSGWWSRTCPRDFSPGVFPTVKGYVDPFILMQMADPHAERVASVLVQQAVRAAFSGAAVTSLEGTEISGVRGPGDNHMSGLSAPEDLPSSVVAIVTSAIRDLQRQLGHVRVEWVLDDDGQLWILQLNLKAPIAGAPVHRGVDHWILFDPTNGALALSQLVKDIGEQAIGVEFSSEVGATSHLADVLRMAGLPWRFSERSAQHPRQ